MTYKYNEVTYSTKIDNTNQTVDFSVVSPKKPNKPQHLYKYYSLTNNSVNAVVNHYLFSSHPMQLNDKYDCAGELIDYSNLKIENFVSRLSIDLKLYSEDKVKQLYNSQDRWILDRTMADLNQIILFLKIGVISLSEIISDPLMWAYYTKNSGFVIKFKTGNLPKEYFGPFPINYSKALDKIDFSKYDPSLCILYQSNVKDITWESENEWRYLTFNRDGKYHPLYSKNDIKSRMSFYNPHSIDEIILGYDFFNPVEIDYNKRTSEYDIINLTNRKSPGIRKLKIKLLNYIVNNSIPCSQIVRHRYSYLLDNKVIKIERLSCNKFKVFNAFKQIES